MSILVYSPHGSASDHICGRLSHSTDQTPGLEITRCASAAEFTGFVAAAAEIPKALITHDEHFDTLLDALEPFLESMRLIVLAEHDLIPDLQQRLGSHPVMPLPGTGYALRVMLSEHPANDPACRLDEFQLAQLLSYGRMTHTFEATQTSIERPVFLHLLNHEHTHDAQVRREFLEDIQAKAKANHGSIIPVFQAIDNGIQLYYTEEHLLYDTLADRIRNKEPIEPTLAVHIVRAAASVLLHLLGLKVNSHQLEPEHIFLIQEAKDHCRIENTAYAGTASEEQLLQNLRNLLPAIIQSIDSAAPHATEVIDWLDQMMSQGTAPSGLRSTSIAARELLAKLEGRATAITVRPQDQSFVPKRAGGPGRPLPQKKKSPVPWIVAAVLAAVGLIVGLKLTGSNPAAPELPANIDLEEMVQIKGGSYRRDNASNPIKIETFWLSAHEVTIGQYAEFLDYLESSEDSDYLNHRNQPSTKRNHVPANWSVYYPLATAGGNYQGHKLTLHHPVFGVDWWDAYAYARWRGRRLPSEEEWEFAALGNPPRKYPWGHQWKPAFANTGADSRDGSVDGSAMTSAVYHPAADRTPEGVMGLAGNVAEWTASEVPDPSDPDLKAPVVKGGSYYAESVDLTARSLPTNRSSHAPYVGFRTATSRNPD
ncbi:SUMF1/EgtB/PvdO family nonheme iron enzyme [Sulfuriroseicoccus oceanibius]|uniref:SUMF1/EgtB/PvdO family nonheme iron enzyme n=1 Tax=Sulfuriroseicoccus oceanibius TaxID=2707525 RepID=A0A6B3L7K9_9BACT|nr:SUMF1/EgtB/PvdO family nonheme iron enzyme [Sulfuriroseicoccus oceanibius]QQL45659.1 SUMF1/EgtB/PvdO family nonheme iron enzyme [Sulfuriroseicoccus oceanibius]